jgi:hypothetical protein
MRTNRGVSEKANDVHFPDVQALMFVLLRRFGLYRGRVILSMHGSDIRSGHRTTGAVRARGGGWLETPRE